MARPSHRSPRGPIEDLEWPTTLEARVVEPGPAPRIQGYDVQSDLARHYGFAELALVALGGEAPSRELGRLLEIVMLFLSPCSVAEAPGHGALLVRACGARTPAVLASGAIALAEEAATVVAEHGALLEWLDDPTSPFPATCRCPTEAEREAVGRFRDAIEEHGVELAVLEHDPSLRAALLAAAHRCGVRDAERLQALWVLARLPAVMAEGLQHERANLRRYPIDLPHFHYVPPEPAGSPGDQ